MENLKHLQVNNKHSFNNTWRLSFFCLKILRALMTNLLFKFRNILNFILQNRGKTLLSYFGTLHATRFDIDNQSILWYHLNKINIAEKIVITEGKMWSWSLLIGKIFAVTETATIIFIPFLFLPDTSPYTFQNWIYEASKCHMYLK